ncbi:MAK10-like protein [Tanacetum coccineum]|uniref:MAK10-like protein n=1 Tax=Tanacetum coccineum TaxID=301880 RepID=A0ABQ5HYP0_9ASTR
MVTDLATIVEEETTSINNDREREAKIAHEAWGLSMDSSNYVHSDVMSLRTTVVAQSALISELQSADHRRQRVISELLTSDHKRQVQLTKTLRLLKGLQTQMVEFQRQHGPAEGPSQPDAPGEAGTVPRFVYVVACICSLSFVQVKYDTYTLQGNALTWWNSYVKTTTPEAAHAMPWRTLKKMMTDKYRPRGEIKKLEFEMWNLKVKGNDVVAYSQRFQELALMYDRIFPEEIDQVEKYVGGLPDMIHGSVMATKPKIEPEICRTFQSKCYADDPLVMLLEGIHVDCELQFMEELVEIIEREIKRLKRSRIPLVKVRWNFRRGPEFTWECEESFRQKYPQLFTNRASSSNTRTEKLRNDILMSQQHHGESLSEAWTRFRDLLQKVPHHGVDLWLQALLEDLALYDNESWNEPRDFAKPVKAIALPQDVPSTFDRHLIELENQVQRLMEAHLALTQPTQVNKVTTSYKIRSGPYDTQYCMEDPEQAFVEYASSCTDEAGVESLELAKNGSTFVQREIPAKIEDPGLLTLPCRLGDSKPFDTLAGLGSCVNIIPLYLFKKLNIGLLEETDRIFGLADGTKSYPVRIVKDVEVHIEKLKLLNDFYVNDMKKDPETPLLVGRGFLATANAVIYCKMTKIAVGEGITRSVFGVKGVDLGEEEAHY